MITMLAELTLGQFTAAVAAGVVAGAGALKGFQYHRRNGNGKGQPGHTQACIDHLTQMGRLEEAVKYIRKDLKRIEHDLGEDMKEIKKKLDQALER